MREESEIREIAAAEIARFECAYPEVTEDIDAVFVFSGPGTVCEPLSVGDSEWTEWCDLDRVARGISIVLRVTAIRLSKAIVEVTKDDVERRGPYFIYNGVNSKFENQDLLDYLSLPRSPIPKSRLVVIKEIEEKDGQIREIKHTGDQVATFPSHMLGKEIQGSIALVSNAPHFSRILRYMAHHRPITESHRIRVFPIHSRPEWAARYANSEIEALVRYVKAGFLAEDPYPTDLGLA